MDWRYNTIWWEQIAAENQINYDFKQKDKEALNLDIEYAIVWHLKQKGEPFELLPTSDRLLYLELIWANIKNFKGIERFKYLKKLELSYCTKLETDAGITLLADSIEYLHINRSRKLSSIDEISKLTKLKGLRLNACGPLESLNFLKNLPNLIDFRFVDTNFLDGDLTPLIEHPTLRSVGFLNKRHYNYTEKEIDLALENKSNDEYMDFVYKGKYKTFKFN